MIGAMARFLEMPGHPFQATDDRVEPLGERRVVTHEQQEQPVADGVEGQRTALPDPQLVRLEDRAAEVMQFEIALEADGGRQPDFVECLDLGQMLAVGGDLGEDRVPTAVTELIVVGVDAEERRGDRIVAHQPSEARLDQVVEPCVERAGLRRGGGPREGGPSGVRGEGQTCGAPGSSRRRASPSLAVSLRRSRGSAPRWRPASRGAPSG